MSSELNDLLVDGKEIDKNFIAEILSPYIKIDKNTCEIRPLGKWNELKANVKIVIYLLARKAMVALELDIEEEAASNAEIINNTGVKTGTVHPALRELYNKRILEQTKEQKYYVPNYSLENVKAMISEKQVE